MPRARKKADGLPFRVYERHGKRVYSIGHMALDGTWSFRISCPADDKAKIAATRREAIARAATLGNKPAIEDTFGALADAWLKYQEDKPLGSEGRRAQTTLDENKREIAKLKSIMGDVPVLLLEKTDAYAYLDAAEKRSRGPKANKEISLARTILEYGIRVGMLKTNAFADVEKLVTKKYDRRVEAHELALAVEVGRQIGGPQLICALGLKTAYLCLKRSVEVRALTRDMMGDEGITWQAAKRKRGTAQLEGLIKWSDELRATVDEALAVKRNKLAGSWYVFGNLSGQRYTKGGWKKTLSVLMTACVKLAEQRKLPFAPFSLQDCRPMGVTKKLDDGHTDVQEATLHTNKRMIESTYDRRRLRVAGPAE